MKRFLRSPKSDTPLAKWGGFGLLILLAALFVTACGAGEEPLDLQAERPAATLTATPFPTRAPTSTPAPLPTSVPTPSPTPLPPVVAKISGPRTIPPGLPRSVTWHIRITAGAELVIASVDDLGGSMLTGDTEGKLVLARTLLPAGLETGGAQFESEWLITGVADPNVGQGKISFYLETAQHGEAVTLPWAVGNAADVESQQVTITVDGVVENLAALPAAGQTGGQPGLRHFSGAGGVSFDYPEGWFVVESPDGIIQLSPDPMPAADGARPAGTPYATLIAGSREMAGVPAGVDLSAGAVIDWLLGDLTTIGGSGAGTFLSDQLEVLDRRPLETAKGSTAEQVILRSTAGSEAERFQASFTVLVRSEAEIYILSAFEPAGKEISPALNRLVPTLAMTG